MRAISTAFAISIAFAPALLASASLAHEPRKGPNGGALVDAGNYHIEVIGRDTTIEVLVSDATDKPLRSTGFKALAIMVIDGKSQRVALAPSADGQKLTGTAPAPLTSVKGVIQLTDKEGKTATGRVN